MTLSLSLFPLGVIISGFPRDIWAQFLFIKGLEARTFTSEGMRKQLIRTCSAVVGLGPHISPRWLSNEALGCSWNEAGVNSFRPCKAPGMVVQVSWSDHKSEKDGCVSDNKELHKARNKHQYFKTLGGNLNCKAFYHHRPSPRGASWSYTKHILLQALGFQWVFWNRLNCSLLFRVCRLVSLQQYKLAAWQERKWNSIQHWDWKL